MASITFGKKLQEFRRSKGFSQRQLADAVGVDFSYISKIENGRMSAPAADTIVKICEVLQIPPDDLLQTAGKVPKDVEDVMTSSRGAVQFMRNAKDLNLSEPEWETMVRKLKRLRSQ